MTNEKTIDASDDDAVLARAAEIQAERAAKAQADRVTRFAPLVALVDSEAFKTVRDQVQGMKADFVSDPNLYITLDAFAGSFRSIESQLPADVRQPPAAS